MELTLSSVNIPNKNVTWTSDFNFFFKKGFRDTILPLQGRYDAQLRADPPVTTALVFGPGSGVEALTTLIKVLLGGWTSFFGAEPLYP